jgi:hypothetical protein
LPIHHGLGEAKAACRTDTELTALGGDFAPALCERLSERFATTARGNFVKLGYLLTRRGLAYFRRRYTGVIDDRRSEAGEVAPDRGLAAAIEERDARIAEIVNFQTEKGASRTEPAERSIPAWFNTDPASLFQGKDSTSGARRGATQHLSEAHSPCVSASVL